MATIVVRRDTITDFGQHDTAYVGSSGGDTRFDTVEEAIDALSFDGEFHSATTRDVTDEVAPVIAKRGKFRYHPDGDVRYVEVTTKRVLAVYRGTLRPSQ